MPRLTVNMDVPYLPVTVLGAGAWGTALAAAAAGRNVPTVLWARDAGQAKAMQQHGTNDKYLPGIPLNPGIRYESDLDAALAHVSAGHSEQNKTPGLIILATPMAGLRHICQAVAQYLERHQARIAGLVWTCKGLDADNAQLPHEIVDEAIAKSHPDLPVGALSGPSFAREVAMGLPVALTVASKHPSLCETVTQALHGGNIRIYSSSDVLGVCVGGALKNIMAIACGISDGLQLGTNARAALVTRGLAEMTRFGVALGAHPATFYGLTGLGDLVLTATGDLSRNRQVGLAIGRGMSPGGILAAGMTAEGARCAKAVLMRAKPLGISMPITQAVVSVLYEGISAGQCVSQLMARDAKQEAEY